MGLWCYQHWDEAFPGIFSSRGKTRSCDAFADSGEVPPTWKRGVHRRLGSVQQSRTPPSQSCRPSSRCDPPWQLCWSGYWSPHAGSGVCLGYIPWSCRSKVGGGSSVAICSHTWMTECGDSGEGWIISSPIFCPLLPHSIGTIQCDWSSRLILKPRFINYVQNTC